jgi:mannonate dehydratase
VFEPSYHYADGLLHLTDAPGLGVSFDESAARRYPYQRRYLPVNRLRDGSMFDW